MSPSFKKSRVASKWLTLLLFVFPRCLAKLSRSGRPSDRKDGWMERPITDAERDAYLFELLGLVLDAFQRKVLVQNYIWRPSITHTSHGIPKWKIDYLLGHKPLLPVIRAWRELSLLPDSSFLYRLIWVDTFSLKIIFGGRYLIRILLSQKLSRAKTLCLK